MNEQRILVVDTNILIHISNQVVPVAALARRYDVLLISVVSEIEALGFAFASAEQEVAMREVLNAFQIIPLTSAEAVFTIQYRRRRKSLKLPDAAILATARAAGADLLTENLTDFLDLDPRVRVLGLADL